MAEILWSGFKMDMLNKANRFAGGKKAKKN